MGTKTKQRAVRAFFEVARNPGEEPLIVSRDQVLADPKMLGVVESEMRRQLLDIVNDVEGLDMHESDPWWADVCKASRTRRRAS